MIAVIIPAYRVKSHILGVIAGIGPEVNKIIVVDDACPEASGKFVTEHNRDERVVVLTHKQNKGVGGAVKTGYVHALSIGADICVKVDGDGQMDPNEIPRLVEPLLRLEADYTKCNRFFAMDYLKPMPKIRLFGNAGLSFINKAANGYWNIMDPTNGFTAIRKEALSQLPLDKIADRYFFESDMLFRLSTVRAVVKDVPLAARYDDETSSLSVTKVLFSFPPKLFSRFLKRIFYNYFLRDFNVGSVELIIGMLLLLIGGGIGAYHWYLSVTYNILASSGTVMLSALPVIIGFQSLIAAIHFDVNNLPVHPIASISYSKPAG
ncbi:MAG: glycosyltransferase family 2 protein [Flavobacteriales bacterium]|nr:glycosyltransferase family 2 protein [Flavobacteriales bacterium]